MSDQLGKIQRLELTEGWNHEAYDFTPWLQQNIAELGAALGLDLADAIREISVGDGWLDILACDGNKVKVAIENQLKITDNDHLSRLLIYAAGVDAGVVVWVASAMKDEHWQVLHWLNQQNGTAKFYGVVVELLKIGASRPAPYFKVVVAPEDLRGRNTGNRQAITHRQISQNNYKFSQELADQLRHDHGIEIPDIEQYGWFPILKYLEGKDLRYAAIWHDDSLAVEMVIEKYGDGGPEWNQRVFEQLHQHQAAIEEAVRESKQESFAWEPIRRPGVTGRNATRSRVAVYRSGSVHNNREEWAEYRSWFIEKYRRLHDALKPYLGELGLLSE